MEPNQHREVVSKKLAERFDPGDGHTRNAIARALRVWGTPNEIPVLIDALRHPDRFGRAAALDVIGKLKDERAVPAVVACLVETGPEGEAIKALREIGPVAESALVPHLRHRVDHVSYAVVELLRNIGTQRSVPSLREVADDKSYPHRDLAKQAIAAIAARMNK
jgi:HEAT repeat protein